LLDGSTEFGSGMSLEKILKVGGKRVEPIFSHQGQKIGPILGMEWLARGRFQRVELECQKVNQSDDG